MSSPISSRLLAISLVVGTTFVLASCGQTPDTSPEKEAAEVAQVRALASPAESTDSAAADAQSSVPLPNADTSSATAPTPARDRHTERVAIPPSQSKTSPAPAAEAPVDDTHADPHAGHDMSSMADHDMTER